MECLGSARTRLVLALVFGIVTLSVMVAYANNAISLSTLDAISRELNNPANLLLEIDLDMRNDDLVNQYSPLST